MNDYKPTGYFYFNSQIKATLGMLLSFPWEEEMDVVYIKVRC